MNETATQRYRLRRYYQGLVPLFKSPQTQAYLMAILSIFTIAFFGLFAIKPTLVTITALQKQITDKSDLNSKLDEKINALILSQQQYETIEPLLPTVFSLMPNSPEAPLLIRYLENLGIDNQVLLSNINISPLTLFEAKASNATPSANQPDTSKINQITVSLALTGNYANVLNFIDRLTKLDRLISVSSVSITASSENKVKAELSITVDSRAYYFTGGL